MIFKHGTITLFKRLFYLKKLIDMLHIKIAIFIILLKQKQKIHKKSLKFSPLLNRRMHIY
jgi:hypothetical protein